MVTVNWNLIAQAMFCYRMKGFAVRDMPWSVKPEVAAVTCPDETRMYPFEDGVLVGSAEQSFMQAQFAGDLKPGRFVTCTPCFRNEPVIDDLHQKYFMKVELYAMADEGAQTDLEFAEIAQKFVKDYAYVDADIVKTGEGYDLMVAGIEVGSYSTRIHDGHRWTCGTGLAEPRFSTAQRLYIETIRSRHNESRQTA